MSDKMHPLSLNQLLNWLHSEFNIHKSIFGIQEFNFYKPRKHLSLSVIDRILDTPFGPAAGPHTQLAQNIIASYLCGGRFIELKTVQIMDELEIPKPCIDARDEGYNVEWSQELKLQQSLEEYFKSFLIIHFLKKQFKLSESDGDGFIFNMSVGYDLKGIQSKEMDNFIESLKGSGDISLFIKLRDQFLEFIDKNYKNSPGRKEYSKLIEDMNPCISRSVTLSTMHGCPSNEIESIAKYLIKEKGLHTYIKLNPTLLGIDEVQKTLRETGFTYIKLKPDSFDHDLKFNEAAGLIKSLKTFAERNGKFFGIKLSNTLGVENNLHKLSGGEMYMSGRALYPITIKLAHKLACYFNGDINISYSGGVNQLNAAEIYGCGIAPITVATDLLKPGGYLRLKEICDSIDKLPEIKKKKNPDRATLKFISESVTGNSIFKKETRTVSDIKISDRLPLYDCFVAPCKTACPIHQDVPEYIKLIELNKYSEALKLILDKNPLPHITGYVCDHQCMSHCTRIDYDQAVKIRDLKLTAALRGYNDYIHKNKTPQIISNDIKVAVIGAGPSGLSLAHFLSREGFDVTIFEKNNRPGGIVQNVLPKFRLPQEAIDNDIRILESYGVRFIFGVTDYFSIKSLKKEGFKYIYIAIGAEISKNLEMRTTNPHVYNAIEFLRDYRCESGILLGKNVAVIGGGNSAMDSARAALKCDGVKNVYLIYRRTKEFMPADREEFDAAIREGVKFYELLSPVEFKKSELKCQCMRLGDYDPDGRRKFSRIDNSFEVFDADIVIAAIGEHVDYGILELNKIDMDSNKNIIFNPETNETSIANVFIGGDALHGPQTIVKAIADAKKTAIAIMKKENIVPEKTDLSELPAADEIIGESERNKGRVVVAKPRFNQIEELCLSCNYSCNKCVDVCPNRANVKIEINGGLFTDKNQILHIDRLCNECGNCAAFCPYDGAPYKEKITLFENEDDMMNSSNPGFCIFEDENKINKILIRSNNLINEYDLSGYLDETEMNNTDVRLKKMIGKVVSSYSFLME